MAWDQLTAQLKTHSHLPELNGQFFWLLRESLVPSAGAQNSLSPSELKSMYDNTRLMLDMVNYAAESGGEIDSELLTSLRSDALRIRLHISLALARYASDQARESTVENISEAVTIYRDMVQKTFGLMQTSGNMLAPNLACQMS